MTFSPTSNYFVTVLKNDNENLFAVLWKHPKDPSQPSWTNTICAHALSFLLIFLLKSIKVQAMRLRGGGIPWLTRIQRRQIAVLRPRTIIYIEAKEE